MRRDSEQTLKLGPTVPGTAEQLVEQYRAGLEADDSSSDPAPDEDGKDQAASLDELVETVERAVKILPT